MKKDESIEPVTRNPPDTKLEELKRLTDFFEILMQIDQRERKKPCEK